MYVAFTDYAFSGGIVQDESAFKLLEKKARYRIDQHTFGRIQRLDIVPPCVADCMVELINTLSNTDNETPISSFSHDGMNISYAQAKSNDQLCDDLIRCYLTPDLLYRGV